MTTARVLADGHYRVVGAKFNCGLHISGGRVIKNLSSPCMLRLAGLDSTAFFYYAREHGWKIVSVPSLNEPGDKPLAG